jgi:hypothetical protein
VQVSPHPIKYSPSLETGAPPRGSPSPLCFSLMSRFLIGD